MKFKPFAIPVFLLMFSFLAANGIAGTVDSPVYLRILAHLDSVNVVDSHEHLKSESELLQNVPDFFEIMTSLYVRDDIINSGNRFARSESFRDASLPAKERWDSFLPVFERIRNTGYVRGYLSGFKKIYGIDIIDDKSVEAVNGGMRDAYRRGFLKEFLESYGNIKLVIHYSSVDRAARLPDNFRIVHFIDDIINLSDPGRLRVLEDRYRRKIHGVGDMEEIFRAYVREKIEAGAIGFKSSIAYVKSLSFERPEDAELDRLIRKILTFDQPMWSRNAPLSAEEAGILTNGLLHIFLGIIDGMGVPFVFHTGIQTWASLDVRQSDPSLLIPLFREYRDINFLLLHGGYPYVTESVELAKSWRNVYLDLCWLSIISPVSARRILSELLEAVPVNKFWFFGGDAFYPEQAIGHLELAKMNCALVLSKKIEMGIFSEAEALRFADRVFGANVREFFNLK